jgi:hypothetical protein
MTELIASAPVDGKGSHLVDRLMAQDRLVQVLEEIIEGDVSDPTV